VASMTLIAPLIDPTTGLVAGLNCKLFGEDFQRIQQVMCGSMYYNMYLMRYALGISCYGVLFAMCCIVCTGVRHMKHAERKNQISDSFFKKGKDDYSGQRLHGKD
jgi:Na+/alanine symporter